MHFVSGQQFLLFNRSDCVQGGCSFIQFPNKMTVQLIEINLQSVIAIELHVKCSMNSINCYMLNPYSMH